ncbi:ABC transporter ATP-binding protein [Horticoccus sp. 23ND18S-11]|uniref:ABC transporter ATP-binding protein n=1 Tax=Horticoccus sp. 23ND18S-11 TaxID=3391832 RepID=UPI0039C9B5A2
MNIIETQALTRRFGKMEAVHDLTLHVPEGSVFALLGSNGAGKTTTLKLLMNLLAPTAGSARVLGVDSRRFGEREFAQIGYVSENQQQPLWMTVRQFLDFCRPLYPTWDRALEASLLRQFALPESRKLSQLSRGMQMKAALLSSLAYRPKLLVLDEPFSGLDPLVRDEFIRGVLEVSALGEWTVLVSSHDIEEVERLADRVAILDAGRLQLNETTESLQARFRRVEVTGARAAVAAAPGWLELEVAGGLTRFVETRFDGNESERKYREHFGTTAVSVQSLGLREIFMVLARASRNLPAEASA